MAVQDYKINYKSDFVLNINGDAGWAVPFCIKFWTGMPSQAYFVGFNGVKYVNCRVGDTPTQLLVMFDDHHLPIGKLMMQIAYHTTIEEFPGSVFDEVTNARDVIVTIDGTDYQVMLDFTGEDAPELEFDLPAYANEAERIQNELQRQQNEADRITAELQREQATAAAVQGAENVNAQLNGTTLTVTNRQGVSTSVNTKGKQGEQGPVGPQGEQGEQGETGISIVSFTPKSETSTTLIYTVTFSDGHTQDVPIPKGAKGDTGATGPQGPQGDTGVSIVSFTQTGSTTESLIYTVTFSDSTTQQVAIPKGAKGDTGPQGPVGPQGPQGPMGDVAVITPEQQAAFTMYSTTGQNTNGPMTQKAVTDALNNIAASGVSYDNSQSGLGAENVQDAVDGLSDQIEMESVLSYETLSYSTVTGYDCYITRDNVLYDVTNLPLNKKSRCVAVYATNYSCVEITANSNGCYYAFLKSFTPPSVGETDKQPDFCEGYESRYLIDSGQKKLLFLPQDCNILYIYDGIQTAWRPTLVRVGLGTAKTVSINKTAIDNLQIKLSVQQEVNYADMTGVDGYLADNGVFVDTSSVTPMSTRRRSVPIPVDGCLSFSYIASSNGITYAFLTSRNFTYKQRADFVEGYEYVIKDTDNDGTLKYVPIPYGCKYLYVYDGVVEEGRRNYRPQYISRGYPISSSSESISADLNEVKKLIANAQKGNSIDNEGRVYPDDVTILNVERRASQMLDVQWTALAPIASTSSRNGIAAGEHTGLPYTSCMEVDKFVGYDVTLLTFMTAANNPYSLLYTEDLKVRGAGQHGSSGYGFTYHGTRATIGGYMGIVCNIFALGSDGMEIPFDTGMFAWLAEQGVFTKIYDQSAQGVRIGDIIWEPGHGNVITDLWRNQRGEVSYVDWSESKADFPITTHMTPTQFNARLDSEGGIIYRYNELYKNIKYIPSPFVAVEGETSQTYVYNDDICTFAGDYACFRVGFPIYINYNLKSVGTWTTMQLYKDNSLLNTYNLDTSSHRLSLGSSLAAGKYKARLANGSTYSDYTYFEVVQTNATYANVGEDVKRVTFGSSNGTPMYVRCSGVDGAPMCLYPLTDEDIANGYCEVNFKSLIQKQYNNLASHTGNVYCKVTFKGEYGRVTNEPILTDL